MLNIKYHNLIKLKLLNKMYTQAEYSKPQRGPQSWHILSFPVHEHYVCGLAKIPVTKAGFRKYCLDEKQHS